MALWNLHLLNSRQALTGIMAEIRATSREAVTRAGDHADLPDFDLVVQAVSAANLADPPSQIPVPGLIWVPLNPGRFDRDRYLRRLLHEIALLIRSDGPGYGRSLGEALVSEGLAGHFVRQVLSRPPETWETGAPSASVLRRAMNEWARLDYDHEAWFRGRGDLRKGTGYGLGNRLVAEHLARHENETPASLLLEQADAFRSSLRLLAAADGSAEDADPENSEPPVPGGGDAAPDGGAV